MPHRSTKANSSIDPISLTFAALKAVKVADDYHRIGNTTDEGILTVAWNQLPEAEQQRLADIVNSNTKPTPQMIADELTACGTLIQLQAVKTAHGDMAVKSAWKLLPQADRDRLTAICNNQPEKLEPVTETPASHYVEDAPQPELTSRKRSLIELSDSLQQLDELLETIENGNIPVDLQTAVDELLAQREATNEALLEKLDNYCGLVHSRLMWAAARKAEADRLAKLAESDLKTVDFLKGRLKAHLEATDQKKLRTKRFNISVCQNGGKAPIRFDETPPEQMPERFQHIQIEPDKEAIRSALEQGEELKFAYLAPKETHIRIK